MSFRFDTPLITSAYHFGNRGLGVLGSEIPSTGTNGPSYMYNDLTLPADNAKEYSGFVVTPPGIGTFFAYEDGSFTYTGASTSFVYKLREDGVDKGNQTVTLAMSSDSSATVGYTESNDASAISANAALPTVSVIASYTEVSDVSSIAANAALPSVLATTSYTEVSDMSALAATSSLPVVLATAAYTEASDVTAATMSVVTSGGFSYIESNDTAVVIVNSLPTLIANFGLLESSDKVLAVIGSGTSATTVTLTFNDRNGHPRAYLTGMKWAFFDQTTPNNLGTPSAKGSDGATDAHGVAVINISGTSLSPGATGWFIFSNSNGTATQTNLISFAGPVVTT